MFQLQILISLKHLSTYNLEKVGRIYNDENEESGKVGGENLIYDPPLHKDHHL